MLQVSYRVTHHRLKHTIHGLWMLTRPAWDRDRKSSSGCTGGGRYAGYLAAKVPPSFDCQLRLHRSKPRGASFVTRLVASPRALSTVLVLPALDLSSFGLLPAIVAASTARPRSHPPDLIRAYMISCVPLCLRYVSRVRTVVVISAPTSTSRRFRRRWQLLQRRAG